MYTNLQSISTGTLRGQLAIKLSLKIPQSLKRVATLPREMQIFKNAPTELVTEAQKRN